MSPRAIFLKTSQADRGRSNPYSPACSLVRGFRTRAALKTHSLRMTPASASMEAIFAVEVPGGMSTNTCFAPGLCGVVRE